MNSPTEISPDTQLLLDELRKLSVKQSELFADLAATISRTPAPSSASISPAAATSAAASIQAAPIVGADIAVDNWGGLFDGGDVSVPTQVAVVEGDVVADNWGGHFDGGDDSIEQHCAAQSVVADNWGGLFNPSGHIPDERDVAFMRLASTEQIRISELKAEPVWLPGFCLGPLDAEATEYPSACDELTPSEPEEEELSGPSRSTLFSVSSLMRSGPLRPSWAALGAIPRVHINAADPCVELAASPRVSVAKAPVLLTYGVAMDAEPQRHILNPSQVTARKLESGLGNWDVVVITFDLDHHNTDHEHAFTMYTFELFRIGPVECVLPAILLGGYDSSLDDDPATGFVHFCAPLDRAIGRVGQALAGVAALRADAVGAAGGGLLAWVVAASLAQATCSTVCLPVAALWEEEMLRFNHNMNLCDVHSRSRSVGLVLDPDPLHRRAHQLGAGHQYLEFHLADTNSYIPTSKMVNREQKEVLSSKPVVAVLTDELECLQSLLASALMQELSSPMRCLMQCDNYFTATPSASASCSSRTLAHCVTGFPLAISASCSRRKIQGRYITNLNPVHSMVVVLPVLAIDAHEVLMGFESVANQLGPLSGNDLRSIVVPMALGISLLDDVMMFDCVDLRPVPWPSFSTFNEFTAGWSFCLIMLPSAWWNLGCQCRVFDRGKYRRVVFSVMAIFCRSFRVYTSLDISQTNSAYFAIWFSSNQSNPHYSYMKLVVCITLNFRSCFSNMMIPEMQSVSYMVLIQEEVQQKCGGTAGRWMDSKLWFGIILMLTAAQASVFLQEGKFSEATHITMSSWLAGDQTYSEKPGPDSSLTASTESVEALTHDALANLNGSQILLSVSMTTCTLNHEQVQRKCGGLLCSQSLLPSAWEQIFQMRPFFDIITMLLHQMFLQPSVLQQHTIGEISHQHVSLSFSDGVNQWAPQWPSFCCSGADKESQLLLTEQSLWLLLLQFYHLMIEDP